MAAGACAGCAQHFLLIEEESENVDGSMRTAGSSNPGGCRRVSDTNTFSSGGGGHRRISADECASVITSDVTNIEHTHAPDPVREFRDALERHITQTEMTRDGYKLPTVTVVVNGSIETLRTVLERLQARPRPCSPRAPHPSRAARAP